MNEAYDKDNYLKCHKKNTGQCKECGKCDGEGRVEMDIDYCDDDFDVKVSYDD
jgi:hypothetical protein